MLVKEKAEAFAGAWIAAWNNHDIEAILAHYADELAFYSPLVLLLKFNDSGLITSKGDLKKYFEIGLKNYPDLHFVFHHCFVGINTVVLYYTSVNGKLSAEVFELNDDGLAVKIFCNYAENKII